MSRGKKVLVVTTTFPRHEGDNQPRFVLDLCKSLRGDYEQRVLAPSAPGCQLDERVEGVEVKRFRYFLKRAETLAYGSGIPANLKAAPIRWLLVPFFLCGLVLALRRELRRFDPDIVHAHWWLPAGFAACLAIATTRGEFPLLITCHGTDYFVLGERFARLRRRVFNCSAAVAMVSPAMRDHAIGRGLPQEKLRVAPMGVDLRDQFSPGSDADRRGVLFVGTLIEKKGVDDLLAAWAAVSENVRAHGLTIVGGGDQRQALQALATSLGIADSVSFAGPVTHKELPRHYQRAALLVFPSMLEEGLGLVAIEAMGCGCPVLAADVRSLADVIVDGQSGFVYPAGDAATLARKIEELVSSPERRDAAARGGRDIVISRFDWTAVRENYRSLYEGLLHLVAKD